MPDQSKTYDIIVAGSGFAGSLAALALAQCGFSVCLIEKGTHPRFAIGESSTPIADMILRSLSSRYKLSWLSDFSRYGSWQKAHPDIGCGIKRGFSYFKHEPHKEFSTDAFHSNELLVAASASDLMSDTNWFRSDFDAFLVKRVVGAGIDYFDQTRILSAKRKENTWTLGIDREGDQQNIHGSFLIDASGSGALAEQVFGLRSDTGGFHTHSFSIFSHFENLPRWTDILHQKNIPTTDYPYDPDHSALHHILDEGWAWSLRFNNNRTSFGFVLNGNNAALQRMETETLWRFMLERYPDLDRMFSRASLSEQPGRLLRSDRLQRRLETCFGEGWVALPHTTGFVDPLFSTGIAHSLSGLEKIIEMLAENPSFDTSLYERLGSYEQMVFAELELIDLLVAGCYLTMSHFPLFNAWSMLYFALTIQYEQRRLNNLPVDSFLQAGNDRFRALVKTTYLDLLELTKKTFISPGETDRFTKRIRERIAPFNTAGLLDPASGNMYHHTVAAL